MKKIFALLLVLAMVLALGACGKESTAPAATPAAPAGDAGNESAAAAGDDVPSGETTGEEKQAEEIVELTIVGTYEIVSAQKGDEIKTPEDTPDMVGSYITLNADGTGEMRLGSEMDNITWDDAQIYDSTGEGVPYTWELNTLTLDVYGVILVFER